MTPLVVIGDVHGELDRLRSLYEQVSLLGRRLVFLGDYVNRGPNSAGVLEFLCNAKRSRGEELVLLAGNHEVALLRYLDHGDFGPFAAHGGMATIRSYVGLAHGNVHHQFNDAFPAAHELLLRDYLVPFYETAEVLLSHTGFDPHNPSDRTRKTLVETPHPEIFDRKGQRPRQLVVCGHYVQRVGRPYVSDQLLCIDTGCGTTGGPLTAVLLPERQFISA